MRGDNDDRYTQKELAVEFTLDGKTCHIGGISKGSGMINPNMATMLAFITTDVKINAELLHKALKGQPTLLTIW